MKLTIPPASPTGNGQDSDDRYDVHDHAADRKRQFARLYRAASRGFAISLLLRGGLHAFTMLTHLAKRQPVNNVTERLIDSLRWGCALGCFGSVYVTVDEATRVLVGCNRSAHYRAALAGALAGPSILLTGLHKRNDELALYFFLRGLTLLIRIGNKPPITHPQPGTVVLQPVADSSKASHSSPVVSNTPFEVVPTPRARAMSHSTLTAAESEVRSHAIPAAVPMPSPVRLWTHKLLAPTRWEHGDTALMCIASWQIVNCYLRQPEALPPSFTRFLDKMAGFEWVVPAARVMVRRNASSHPSTAPIATLHGTPFAHRSGLTLCDILHPHTTGAAACDRHFLSVMPSLFWRSLSVYLPVYAASTVAVQRGRLLKSPVDILVRAAGGMARSAAFLGLYVSLAHRSMCWANTGGFRHGISPASVAAVAWIPGLATLLEKKSRRMELAIFCACRALLSFCKQLLLHKAAPRWLVRSRTDILGFCAACACLMHCYSGGYGGHRDIFRSKYLNVLDFIFGSRGLRDGFIEHERSNLALIRDSMRTISSAPNLLALTR